MQCNAGKTSTQFRHVCVATIFFVSVVISGYLKNMYDNWSVIGVRVDPSTNPTSPMNKTPRDLCSMALCPGNCHSSRRGEDFPIQVQSRGRRRRRLGYLVLSIRSNVQKGIRVFEEPRVTRGRRFGADKPRHCASSGKHKGRDFGEHGEY